MMRVLGWAVDGTGALARVFFDGILEIIEYFKCNKI
jgi:hypothetical protein